MCFFFCESVPLFSELMACNCVVSTASSWSVWVLPLLMGLELDSVPLLHGWMNVFAPTTYKRWKSSTRPTYVQLNQISKRLSLCHSPVVRIRAATTGVPGYGTAPEDLLSSAIWRVFAPHKQLEPGHSGYLILYFTATVSCNVTIKHVRLKKYC